jgi:hypothetical protein
MRFANSFHIAAYALNAAAAIASLATFRPRLRRAQWIIVEWLKEKGYLNLMVRSREARAGRSTHIEGRDGNEKSLDVRIDSRHRDDDRCQRDSRIGQDQRYRGNQGT